MKHIQLRRENNHIVMSVRDPKTGEDVVIERLTMGESSDLQSELLRLSYCGMSRVEWDADSLANNDKIIVWPPERSARHQNETGHGYSG